MNTRYPTACLALALLAGCQPARRSAVPTPRPPAPSANQPSQRPAKGALNVGMSADEVKKLPNMTVEPLTTHMEGVKGKALRISRFGQAIGLAELEGGKVVRLRMYTPAYRAPGGARPGMRPRDLEKLYGPGTVTNAGGSVSATFAKAPDLKFYFPRQDKMKSVKDWSALTALNPKVQYILLTGAPAAAAAKSAIQK